MANNSSIAGVFSYKLTFSFVIIFLLKHSLWYIALYVILVPWECQVIVLVCDILVYFLFLRSTYVSLFNVYLSNL